MKVKFRSIYLPHINYTVCVRPYKKPPDSIGTALAWIQREDKWGCNVYLPKQQTPSELSHEMVHVLQLICADRHMSFTDEFEHMGYIMQYLMGQVLGYEWVMRPKKRKTVDKRRRVRQKNARKRRRS